MNNLSFRPLAKKDLREIMLYFRRINPRLATKFLQETDDSICQIQYYHAAFQKRMGDVQIVYLKTFPFGIL
jgi:hypothetical protein